MKNIVLLILTLTGSVAFGQAEKNPITESTVRKLQVWNLTVGEGKSKVSGHYFHFVKQDGKWQLKPISSVAPTVQNIENEEVLVFSSESRKIQPDFRDMLLLKSNEGFSCTTGVLRTRNDNARANYNPCDSSLTSVQSYNVVSNVSLAVFSFGISALTGTTSRSVYVDPEKMVSLLVETQAMAAMEAYLREIWLKVYRGKFKAIATTKDVDKFISLHHADDPDGLVPQAEGMRVVILMKTEEEKRVKELKRQELLLSQQLADENRERQRVAALKRFETLTSEFRKTIEIGSDTFCGPVINIRGPMIQIASNAASGFTAEPWLKISEVYPRTIATCRNMNGQPIPVFVN